MLKTIYYRCQTCNDECDHNFEFEVFEKNGKFFVGSGPYESKEDAEQVIGKAIKLLEERNGKNRA